MNQSQEDFDLIDLFLILWRGKLILIGFILISILIGYSLFLNEKSKINIKEANYESKLYFSIDMFLPKTNLEEIHVKDIIKEYHKLFYSKGTFENWKNKNLQSNITSDDFKVTEIDSKYFISKSSKVFLKFDKEPNYSSFILMQSKQIPIFDEIISYAEFVSEELNNKIYIKFKDLYKNIDEEFTKFNDKYSNSASADYIFQQIKILKFLESIEEGRKFINFLYYDNPKNLNAPPTELKISYLKILVYAVFGGMIGSTFIFARNAIRRRTN